MTPAHSLERANAEVRVFVTNEKSNNVTLIQAQNGDDRRAATDIPGVTASGA